MVIDTILKHLESSAPLAYQETYDNAGLITGSSSWECSGVLVSLDATEDVVREAKDKKCNLVIAHHPIVFHGLKKINGSNYVEKAIIAAIKNDIAIYAIHTNLDNIRKGVNEKIADRLGLVNRSVLQTKPGTLNKLFTFVPPDKLEQVRNAIFLAGGGEISNYSECSFVTPGTGSFKAGKGTHPYVGTEGERHYENELKVEVIFPAYLQASLVAAMKQAHPYEEVAFDIVPLLNHHPGVGSGMVGDLPVSMDEIAFLELVKSQFDLHVIRHTALKRTPVRKVALCGGAGSFLIPKALASGADFFITADLKYHEFFDANGRLVLADIGHYESEQFTVELVCEILNGKFDTFAVLKTEVSTNPVNYFRG